MRQTHFWSTLLLLCGSTLLGGCGAYKTSSHAELVEKFSDSLGEILPDEPPQPPSTSYKITTSQTHKDIWEGGKLIKVEQTYSCVGETAAEEETCQTVGSQLGDRGWNCQSIEGGVTCSR